MTIIFNWINLKLNLKIPGAGVDIPTRKEIEYLEEISLVFWPE